MNVAICIATYHRPDGLRQLLDSLNHLDFDGQIGIFVADNDGQNHQGFDYIAQHANDYKFKITCEIEPSAGISNARNRTLAMVQAAAIPYDFIAMVDDDMSVCTHWISDMVRTAEIYKADVVFGKREPRFEVVPPDEVLNCAYFHDDFFCRPTGSERTEGGTCNVMFSRKIFDDIGFAAFDPGLGLTGGEDSDLFMRLRGQGYRFVQCATALAYEHLPADRLTAEWIVNRYFRSGSTYTYLLKKHSGNRALYMGLLKKIILLPKLYVSYRLQPTLDNKCKLYNTLGFFHFVKYGAPFQEYGRSEPKTVSA